MAAESPSTHVWRRPAGRGDLALSIGLLAGCSTSLHIWDAHTTATPRKGVRDVTVQRDLIATLSLVTPATLQALNVSVAQALAAALKDVASTIPAVLGHATMSRSTHKDWLLSTRISSRA